VANKLYEYLGARKPIIAFGEADGESLQMLAQAGGHYLISQDDPKSVEAILEKALLEQPPTSTVGSEILLQEWSTQRQMAHLVSRLGLD
jgi:hypothetical protein